MRGENGTDAGAVLLFASGVCNGARRGPEFPKRTLLGLQVVTGILKNLT